MNVRRTKTMRRVRPIWFFLVLVVLTSARADRALVPLGKLISHSDLIIIGAVSEVVQDPKYGEQIATVGVEVVLRGPHLPEVSLRGSLIDPGLPRFDEGTLILAFLRRTESPDTFDSVEGDHGIMHIADAAAHVTRDIVKQAIDQGEKIQLEDVQYAFRTETPALPRVLVGSLLEELTLRVTRDEAPLVSEMACDAEESYYTVPQLWAISRVGALKLAEARACLEEFVKENMNRDRRLAAIEALGDLGDAESISVLMPLLPETQPPLAPIGDDEGRDGDKEIGATPEDRDGDTESDSREEPEEEKLQTRNEDVAPLEPAKARRLQEDPPPNDDSVVEEEKPDHDGRLQRLDAGLAEVALLALGKIHAREAVPVLQRIALESGDFALRSTAVHALGLIGTPEAYEALTAISKQADELIRNQADRTLKRGR